MRTTVKLVRLQTGEEILCTIGTAPSDDFIRICEPTYLMPQQNGNLGLAPFLPYAKAEKHIDVRKTAVMFTVEPVDELAEQYKQIHSKIAVPSQKIIT